MPIACKALSAFVVMFGPNKEPLSAELVPQSFFHAWGGRPAKADQFRRINGHYFVLSYGFDAEFATKNAHAHLLTWEG